MTYKILSKTLVLDISTQYGSMSNHKLQLSALIITLKGLSIATKETINLSLFVNIYPLPQLQNWYNFFVFDDDGELLTFMGNLKCKGFLASIRSSFDLLYQYLLGLNWKTVFGYQGYGEKLSSQCLKLF